MSMAGPKPFIPEVVEPDEALPADLVALRKFASLMDEAVAIPGTRRRVGLDAGLSLIPGVGEIAGGILSAWIIVGALRHRVATTRIVRMVVYILLDVSIGSVPVLGTIFDWLFEENVINLKALLQYRDRSRPPRSFAQIGLTALFVIILIVGVAVAIVAGLFALAIWLAAHR